MTVPDYQTLMLPLLHFLADGRERSLGDAAEALSRKFNLTAEERQQLLPSGTGTVIGSRVGWARTYMKNAGLVRCSKSTRIISRKNKPNLRSSHLRRPFQRLSAA